eukprot:gene26512-32037_t
MANQRIQMFQVKRIIELRVSKKSKRMIAQILGISRNTLDSYLNQLSSHQADLSIYLSWTEEQLVQLLSTPAATQSYPELYALFPSYTKELTRRWQATQKVTMHLEHKAGDKLFVDFAGDKLHLIDPETGGVPQAIVPDNLKAAVTKADRFEPEINETLADFASHY